MIIDSHVHLTAPQIIRDPGRYRKREPYFDLLSSSPRNKYVTAPELIDHMDRAGVDRAVVFGFAFRSMDRCRQANDYTLEAVARYPERLIGYAVVRPQDRGLEAELDRCRQGGLKGVGELFPTGQEFDLTAKGPLEQLCAFCRRQHWPILIHLNEPVGHHYVGKTADSLRQGAALAGHFPDNTFIFAHLGGGLCFYETMPELKASLKRVYYDTAALPFLYHRRIYEGLRALGLVEKILLASDYPLISPGAYIRDLDQTALSPTEKELIQGGNLRRILNL